MPKERIVKHYIDTIKLTNDNFYQYLDIKCELKIIGCSDSDSVYFEGIILETNDNIFPLLKSLP